MAKIFFLLFAIVLVSTIILVRETITLVSGLSPTFSDTYPTSPQNSLNNLTSFRANSDETQILQDARNIVKLLADMVQNRLHDAVNLLELTSTEPDIKNTSLVGDISKAYMGIPSNMDIQGRKIAKDILNRDEDFGSVYFTTPKGDVYFGEPYADSKATSKA